MTLQTTINGIDSEYPIAGQDNNSQGFRDNFSYIKTALTIANQELTTLQSNAVLKGGTIGTVATSSNGSDITVDSTTGLVVGMPVTFGENIGTGIIAGITYYIKTILPGAIITVSATEEGDAVTVGTTSNIVVALIGSSGTGIENDLLGGSINNGYYNNFHGISYVAAPSGDDQDIDVRNGTLQVFTLSSDATFTFRHWPANDAYAHVRLHFASDGTGTYNVDLNTENAGEIIFQSGFPTLFEVNADETHQIIEAWSYNDGATVYVQYIGSLTNNNDGVAALDDIGDVAISAARIGDALRYNGSVWSNQTDTMVYNVTIDDNGSGNQEAFYIQYVPNPGDTSQPVVELRLSGLKFYVGKKYRFNINHVSNTAAPLRFSTTPDTAVPASITPYTTNVYVSGTPGVAGAYVEILVTNTTPSYLFMYGDETGTMLDTSLLGAGYPIMVGDKYYTGTEDLANGAAVSLATTVSTFTTNTGETATLAAGRQGQIKTFVMTGDGGDMVISVNNPGWTGTGTITFDNVGDGCTLQYLGTKWYCIGNNGAIFG